MEPLSIYNRAAYSLEQDSRKGKEGEAETWEEGEEGSQCPLYQSKHWLAPYIDISGESCMSVQSQADKENGRQPRAHCVRSIISLPNEWGILHVIRPGEPLPPLA